MATVESILSWATAVANDWRVLAMWWHIAFAALVIALVSGFPPTRRLLGFMLALPVISVAVLAWISRNPFNALSFTVLAVLLLRAASGLPLTTVMPASSGWVLAGAGLLAFGWTYPHFLITDTWTAYLYTSPFGLLPCPTLLVVIGMTLIFRGLYSMAWSIPLLAAGVLYGVIGVFILRVSLDIWLLSGSILLAVMIAADWTRIVSLRRRVTFVSVHTADQRVRTPHRQVVDHFEELDQECRPRRSMTREIFRGSWSDFARVGWRRDQLKAVMSAAGRRIGIRCLRSPRPDEGSNASGSTGSVTRRRCPPGVGC